MTLEEIGQQIKICKEQMDSRYGSSVFDEWAVVSLVENRARVLAYTGPRNDDFLKNFARDLGSLRASLTSDSFGAGDFEFARHSTGTGYEGFLVVGQGLFLICNNTSDSLESIAKNPRWLAAQVPFVEMAERVRTSPLAVAWDTRIFTKPN
ncbi:MAG TPA: hypothetical protein VG347_01165 [Verrucomicrobiae bacterium]|nr:hypothetical protein [Verrucomicrobiae bacterium]